MALNDSDQQDSAFPLCDQSSGKCSDEELGKALVLYQTGLMSQEQQHEFEAHLLECDACFDSLRRLDDAMGRTLDTLFEQKKQRPESPEMQRGRNPGTTRN